MNSKMRDRLNRRLRSSRGQSLVEFAIMAPFIVIVVLGVIELSYGLLDQHVVAKVGREGSNLISRNVTLLDASNALQAMRTRPVDFTTRTTAIFSVIWRVSTTGAPNYGFDILFQRYQFGAISATSGLTTAGGGSFGGPPDYFANNPSSDTSLRITNLPPNLNVTGGLIYVTEVFTQHTLLTPLDQFGTIQTFVPNRLYSIAYF